MKSYTFYRFSSTNANNIYSWVTTGVDEAWEESGLQFSALYIGCTVGRTLKFLALLVL